MDLSWLKKVVVGCNLCGGGVVEGVKTNGNDDK